MPDLGPVAEGLAQLVGPIVGALLRTTIGTISLGVGCAAMSFWLAAHGSTTRGLLAVGLVLLLSAIIGVILVMKRTVLTAMLHGVQRLGLGKRTVGALFQRMLGLGGEAGQAAAGERGGGLVKTVERLPLAQAETRLRQAAEDLLKGDSGAKGFLMKTIRHRLIELVERLTLARFRAEGAQAGGVDVLKVRDELSSAADNLLADVIGAPLKKITLLLVGAVLVGSIVLSLVISRLPI